MEETSVAKAMAVIRAALEEDPAYAFGWHSNIAMMCVDAIHYDLTESLTSEDACRIGNDAASRFMKLCFGVKTSRDMLLDELTQLGQEMGDYDLNR